MRESRGARPDPELSPVPSIPGLYSSLALTETSIDTVSDLYGLFIHIACVRSAYCAVLREHARRSLSGTASGIFRLQIFRQVLTFTPTRTMRKTEHCV